MSEPHRIASPARMRVLYTAGVMNVYRSRMLGTKPYAVGTERIGRLILLEEFDDLKEAKDWADENKGG